MSFWYVNPQWQWRNNVSMITLLTNSHQSSEYEIMYSSFKYHIQNFQVHNTHYNDVIMTTMASQITSLKMVYSTVCSVADHWPLWGEFTGDRWIPRTKASSAENVSIWWRHHADNTSHRSQLPAWQSSSSTRIGNDNHDCTGHMQIRMQPATIWMA